MGFTEVLTIVFIVLKLLHVINWSWFFVLLPEIIMAVIYVFAVIMIAKEKEKHQKRFRKQFKDFD